MGKPIHTPEWVEQRLKQEQPARLLGFSALGCLVAALVWRQLNMDISGEAEADFIPFILLVLSALLTTIRTFLLKRYSEDV